jgi:hypothetical protein
MPVRSQGAVDRLRYAAGTSPRLRSDERDWASGNKPDRDVMLTALPAQEIAVEFIVGVREEHSFGPISALRYMEGSSED